MRKGWSSGSITIFFFIKQTESDQVSFVFQRICILKNLETVGLRTKERLLTGHFPSKSCKLLTSDSNSVRLPTRSLHSTAKSSRWSWRHSSSCTQKGNPLGFINYITDQGKLRYQRLLPFQWSFFSFHFKTTSLNRTLKFYLFPKLGWLER